MMLVAWSMVHSIAWFFVMDWPADNEPFSRAQGANMLQRISQNVCLKIYVYHNRTRIKESLDQYVRCVLSGKVRGTLTMSFFGLVV